MANYLRAEDLQRALHTFLSGTRVTKVFEQVVQHTKLLKVSFSQADHNSLFYVNITFSVKFHTRTLCFITGCSAGHN